MLVLRLHAWLVKKALEQHIKLHLLHCIWWEIVDCRRRLHHIILEQHVPLYRKWRGFIILIGCRLQKSYGSLQKTIYMLKTLRLQDIQDTHNHLKAADLTQYALSLPICANPRPEWVQRKYCTSYQLFLLLLCTSYHVISVQWECHQWVQHGQHTHHLTYLNIINTFKLKEVKLVLLCI